MFNIGDKVVYPMHGAGVIEAIEENEVLGKRRSYYIMHLAMGGMKVMIPTDNVEKIGIRQVIGSDDDVENVLKILRAPCSENSETNWNRRYRDNMEKLKSGNIFEVAEVVRNLGGREKEKRLSTGERRMLDSARQIMISELMLAKNQLAEEVRLWLQRTP